MNIKLRMAQDLERYADMVEAGELISPDEMNCAALMRVAAQGIAKPWVGLTEDEAIHLLPTGDWFIEPTLEFYRAVEAKLKEKNT